MRTTISIDLLLLARIREIAHRVHKTFTRIVQELLWLGLRARIRRTTTPSPFRHLNSRDMGALIDYTDKEALNKMLDQHPFEKIPSSR